MAAALPLNNSSVLKTPDEVSADGPGIVGTADGSEALLSLQSSSIVGRSLGELHQFSNRPAKVSVDSSPESLQRSIKKAGRPPKVRFSAAGVAADDAPKKLVKVEVQDEDGNLVSSSKPPEPEDTPKPSAKESILSDDTARRVASYLQRNPQAAEPKLVKMSGSKPAITSKLEAAWYIVCQKKNITFDPKNIPAAFQEEFMKSHPSSEEDSETQQESVTEAEPQPTATQTVVPEDEDDGPQLVYVGPKIRRLPGGYVLDDDTRHNIIKGLTIIGALAVGYYSGKALGWVMSNTVGRLFRGSGSTASAYPGTPGAPTLTPEMAEYLNRMSAELQQSAVQSISSIPAPPS
jgi:hypothetical protein